MPPPPSTAIDARNEYAITRTPSILWSGGGGAARNCARCAENCAPRIARGCATHRAAAPIDAMLMPRPVEATAAIT